MKTENKTSQHFLGHTIMETVCRFFDCEACARRHAAIHGLKVIPGPEDNWAAVDSETAADFEAGKGVA